MKRNYLLTPGQAVTIKISGGIGAGKPLIARDLVGYFQAKGLFAVHQEEKDGELVVITCPTHAEAREVYLSTLDQQQAMTLRGHLDALGFEL